MQVAIVEAKVWYIREKTESFIQQEKVKTNEVENKYALTLNKNTINFYKTISKFEKYDTMETKNKIRDIKQFLFTNRIQENNKL